MSVKFDLRFKEGDEVGHLLFVREHSTRVEEASRPAGRTVLVCNIPPWADGNTIKRLFSKYGKIESVQVQLKPGKFENSKEEIKGKFTGSNLSFRNIELENLDQ